MPRKITTEDYCHDSAFINRFSEIFKIERGKKKKGKKNREKILIVFFSDIKLFKSNMRLLKFLISRFFKSHQDRDHLKDDLSWQLCAFMY